MEWEEKCYNLCHTYMEKYKQPNIPLHWAAGLFYVENSGLDPRASRFEIEVMKSVDYVKRGNKSSVFPGFNDGLIHQTIMENKDNQTILKSIATSYGLGQLMGYHYIHKWGMKPEQYMNLSLEDSVKYSLLFMQMGHKYLRFPEVIWKEERLTAFAQYLKWHNTGSIYGKTYRGDYIEKAQNVAEKYRLLMEKKGEKNE